MAITKFYQALNFFASNNKKRKAVWVGYWGPMLHQLGKAIDTFIGLEIIIIGFHDKLTGEFNDGRECWAKNQVITICNEQDLKNKLADYSVIFYDTYHYSDGIRPEIFNLIKKNYDITQSNWWKKLSSKKILCDAESPAGQFRAYDIMASHFDEIFTFNIDMKKKYPHSYLSPVGISIPDELIENQPQGERPIDVLYTGSNLSISYRGEISKKLSKLKKDTGLSIVVGSDLIGLNPISGDEWLKLLSKAKIYIATYSCASGEKEPMHIKQKDAYALLYGAVPLTEELVEADQYLTPDKHRKTFKNIEMLDKIILNLLKEPKKLDQIVSEGRKQVIRHYNWKHIANEALKYFKVI